MKVAVIFGGISSEHKVSCVSAASVLRNLDQTKYEILAIGITQTGKWLACPKYDVNTIENDTWDQDLGVVPCVLSPDRETHGVLLMQGNGVKRLRIDCAFPVLHGVGGEDGTLQGLFELSGIPYVGCGVSASANAMDKSLTKIMVDTAGVRQAKYYLALLEQAPDCMDFVERLKQKKQAEAVQYTPQADGDISSMVDKIEASIASYPMFVKPCAAGSSVGVTKAKDREGLICGLVAAFVHDHKVLVEEFIDGQEIECAVLGNDMPIASTVGEVTPAQEFYSYEAKYQDDNSKLFIPARITQQQMRVTQENALLVYRALGCKGLSRVDFFCTRDTGEIVFNEINTLPGFTSISMYPKMLGADGIEYADLLNRLIALAMEGRDG